MLHFQNRAESFVASDPPFYVISLLFVEVVRIFGIKIVSEVHPVMEEYRKIDQLPPNSNLLRSIIILCRSSWDDTSAKGN